MKRGIKDLRNKPLPDLMEKKLIVAKYFIKQKDKGKSFDELGIYNMWTNYFPKDFRLSKDCKLKLKNDGYYNLIPPKNKRNIDNKIIHNYSNKWRKIYQWVVEYVDKHNLEDCNRDLVRIRNINQRELIAIYKPLHYYVKMGTMKISSPHLLWYHALKDGKQIVGTYDEMVEKSKHLGELV